MAALHATQICSSLFALETRWQEAISNCVRHLELRLWFSEFVSHYSGWKGQFSQAGIFFFSSQCHGSSLFLFQTYHLKTHFHISVRNTKGEAVKFISFIKLQKKKNNAKHSNNNTQQLHIFWVVLLISSNWIKMKNAKNLEIMFFQSLFPSIFFSLVSKGKKNSTIFLYQTVWSCLSPCSLPPLHPPPTHLFSNHLVISIKIGMKIETTVILRPNQILWE